MVWQGPTIVAPACARCGQALAEHEASGRALYPVVLPIVILLILLVLAALRLDAVWQPPLWIVALVWAPVALVLVGGAVRLARAAHLVARIAARDQG